MRTARAPAEEISAPVRGRDCGMRIGDHVIYGGRLYVVRGLDPMGVPERRADLEDAETGERLRVPVALLQDTGD